MPPVLAVPNVTAVIGEPLHTTWLLTVFTCAVGFTVIVKLVDRPLQLTLPLVNVGVTVIVAVTGDVPLLIALNEGMPVLLPADVAARPILGVLFVHV